MELLALTFINSAWYNTHDTGAEPFYDPEWWSRLAREWELPPADCHSPSFLTTVFRLRAELFAMAETLVTTGHLSAAQLAVLNGYLAAAPAVRALRPDGDDYSLRLLPVQADTAWFCAEVAASFASIVTELDPERLRLCANPECRWVFYDTTRSRTRRFCDSRCASLLKVRRFRAKRKG